MAARNYNNTTTVGTLNAGVGPADTSMVVNDFSGNPTAPFTITIDRNTATEEVCLVTAVVGSTLTVTRGYDGVAAQSHAAGATVEHTAVALDFSEANAHVNDTSGVHGTTGDVVGTEGAQTIMDKTFTSPVCEANVTDGDAIVLVIPSGAEVRNLLRGENSSGVTVLTVTSSGVLTALGLHSTGTIESDGNATIDGTLTVVGASTLAALTATTASLSSNLTVSGNTTIAGLTASQAAAFSSTVHAVDDISTDADIQADGTLSVTGTSTLSRVRVTATDDASASSTAHGLQVGSSASTNIVIDGDEIIARNNGALSALGVGGCRVTNAADPTGATDLVTVQYLEDYVTGDDVAFSTLTLLAPWTAVSSINKYRIIHGMCYYSLRVTRGTLWTAGTPILTFPAGARPAEVPHYARATKDATDGIFDGLFTVNTDGTTTLNIAGQAGNSVYISGSFPIS